MVFLGTIHDIGDEFGRLAEGQRQNSARQRVKRAAMPGLLRLQQRPRLAERLGRADAQRLIQHHPTAMFLALAAARHQLRSLTTSGSVSRFSILWA